jgi:hypothetical protein
MSSKRRLSSSRANGAKSHGPITAAGKFASAQNATTHGLAAKTLVLTNESRERFQTLFESYQDELDPQTQIEMDLVEQMTVSKWRQRRLWLVESATLDLLMDRQKKAVAEEFISVDEPTRLAIAFQSAAQTGVPGLFHRYETSMRRSWDRALERLESMRAFQESPNEPSPTNEHSDQPCPTHAPTPIS